MSRPGFVLEVDDRTPPIVVHEGEGFRLENFPLGTRVIYPPESLAAVPDVEAAIQHALLNPEGDAPLPELLRAGMRLTIEKVGTLKFNVKDELKRTWARTTRQQHKEAGKEGAHTPQLTGKYAKK